MSKSLITTRKLDPVHPGEILMLDFIEEMGLTQNKVAVAIGVPPRRINEIVHGKRAITADTALRLGQYFSISPEFWLNLQAKYDLDVQQDKISEDLARIKAVA